MATREQRITRARQAVRNLTNAIEDVRAEKGDTVDYERALLKEQATLVKLLDGACPGPGGLQVPRPCGKQFGHGGDHSQGRC